MFSLNLYRLLCLPLLLTGCLGAPAGSEQYLHRQLQKQAAALRLGAPHAEAEAVLRTGPVRVLRQAYASAYLYAFGNGEPPLTVPWPPAREGLNQWPCGLQARYFPLKTQPLGVFTGPPQPDAPGELLNVLVLTPSARHVHRLLIRAGWLHMPVGTSQGPVLHTWGQVPSGLWGRPADLQAVTRRSRERRLRAELRLWQSPWHCEGAQVWLGTVTQAAHQAPNRLGLWSGPPPQPMAPARDQARDLLLGNVGGLLQPTPLHLLARPARAMPVEGLNAQGDPYVSDGMLGVIDQR